MSLIKNKTFVLFKTLLFSYFVSLSIMADELPNGLVDVQDTNIIQQHHTSNLDTALQFTSIFSILLILTVLFVAKRFANVIAKKLDTTLFKVTFFSTLILILLLLLLTASSFLNNFKEQVIVDQEETFNLTRDVTRKSLSRWYGERLDILENITLSKAFNELAIKLILAKKNNQQSDFLLTQKKLHLFFAGKPTTTQNSRAYTLTDNQGTYLLNSVRGAEGKLSTIKTHRPKLFSKVLTGQTEFIPPVWSNVNIDNNGSYIDRDAEIFIAAPVKDVNGEVIAVFAIRFDPNIEFSRLFIDARLGDSFESYAIDSRGYLISESRFSPYLQKQALLPQGESSILNIKLPDVENNPIVLAAKSKTSGQNLAGYKDYRGQLVVGQWITFKGFNFTLVSEIDYDEMYAEYHSISNLLFIALAVSGGLVFALSIFMVTISKRANEISQQSQDELSGLVDERTAELALSEQKNKLVNSSVADGILGVNKEGHFIFANDSAAKILNYSTEEILSHGIISLFGGSHTNISRFEETTVYKAIKEKKVIRVPHEKLVVSLGRVIPVELSISPVENDESELAAVIAFQDITDRLQVERALLDAKKISDDASKAKSDFLANMSHEIRTPMNAIIGMSHLALGCDLDRKSRNYITKSYKAAESLLVIINDILDFSKIESGKFELEAIDFNLHEVFDDLSNIVSLKTHEKGLELLFNIDKDVPLFLVGDGLRLNQILINIAGNATKFTENGEIVIFVSTAKLEDNAITLQFEVKDSGIGMSDEQQSKLFKSFSQADSSTTRKYGGTGLGLTISKKLVEMMSGDIWLESEEGVGSSFFFTAKFQLSDKNNETLIAEQKSFLNGKRILIVDDNSMALDVLSSIMKSFYCNVTCATTGAEAIEITKNAGFDFDFIMLDWKMPGLDGIETCKMIKENSNYSSKNFILVTANAGDDDVLNTLKGAIDSVIVKPVTASTVFDEMMHLHGIDASKQTRDIKRDRNLIHNQNKVAGSHILLVEDNELNQELALELLKQAGVITDLAENGEQAIEKISNNNYDGVLMDLQMPVMDGITATGIIRQDHPNLPIIAMTANAMADDKERVIAAGMNDHITKPINVSNMFSTISKWIKPSLLDTDIIQSKTHLNPNDELAPPLIFKHIEVQSGLAVANHNMPLYIKLIGKFVAGENDFITQFEKVFHAQDYNTATRLAHTLKGSAGNIGAKSLQSAANTLEKACVKVSDTHSESALELVKSLLSPTSIELQLVLNELKAYLGDNKKDVAISSADFTFNEDTIGKLKLLLGLVEDFETDAIEAGDIILNILSGTQQHQDFLVIMKQIENYEFTEAESSLTEFISQIKLT